MIVESIKIKNVLSYKEELLLDLKEDLNVFVGPNGTGKTNLLDIIRLTIKTYLVPQFTLSLHGNNELILQEDDNYLNQINQFQSQLLQKYQNENSERKIEIIVSVDHNDANQIKKIIQYADITKKILLDNFSQSQDLINLIDNFESMLRKGIFVKHIILL